MDDTMAMSFEWQAIAQAGTLVDVKIAVDGHCESSRFNELSGRPEWTRTIDLFRVKEAL